VTSRALAIIDGEHYPPVVRDALAGLPHDVVAAVLVGGTEKLRGDQDYGVPLAPNVEAAIDRYRPEIVVDLSDEPVLGPVERFALASRVLTHGIPSAGADVRLEPPLFAPFELPSVAVVGTGKRVGKTALTGHLARLVSEHRRVVVVAMGRGGPADPERISVQPTVDTLVTMSRAGRHAASDHLETAALVGVETVGCRRCGGGLAGAVYASNVAEGARMAAALAPELVVFDGSGAAIPPISADRTILAVGGHQEPAVAAGYLNAFRRTWSWSRWPRPDRAGNAFGTPSGRSCRVTSRCSPRCCVRVRSPTCVAARSRTSPPRLRQRMPCCPRI
jgi:cyclic 2,3-diphosphoglycerate synthetase